MLEFSIRNAKNEFGQAAERWQAELHIEATFTVGVDDGVLPSEPYWAIIEQAESLAAWISAVTDAGPDYSYTSMDDGQEGLATFTCVAPGRWVIGSAWQAFESRATYTTAELVGECKRFIAATIEAGRPFMTRQAYSEICSSVCG